MAPYPLFATIFGCGVQTPPPPLMSMNIQQHDHGDDNNYGVVLFW
jgi:hypothetical protein